MKSNYAHKLNNANIILGIHIAFKLVIILTLFIVLYTTIWIKEVYLTIIKSSAYIQIFIFLELIIVMLSINNPKSFDICSTFINYFYLISSILELGIIICEIYFLIQNLQNFIIVFHECPYYRTYEEISDKEYKRTCLYYITDYNNELPYKYICYYNSENEYYNEFCDDFICRKNKNKNEINSFVKCFGNVDRTSIHFDRDNEFYLKEIELINRYKSSNLYACFRKEKIIKNENIFNNKCPDSNPIKKMLIFIYTNIILHFFIDFLFIYEFILISKIKEIYSNLVLLQSRAPINYLVNEEELRNENNSNKQTFNTDNRELMANPQSLNTFNIQREYSQTIIIEPGFKNNINNKNKFLENDNNNVLNKDNKHQLNQYDNIEVNYNENNEDEDNIKKTNENRGIINRKSKIFKNLKKKDYQNNININSNENNIINKGKNKNQKMIIVDIKKDEEFGINRINFFIRKKTRKKLIKNKKNNENKQTFSRNSYSKEEGMNTFRTNINGNNKDNINIIDDIKFKKINIISIKPKDNRISENNSNKLKNKDDKNNNRIIRPIINNDIKSNSNIIGKNNNNFKMGFNEQLSDNNSFFNDNKNNSEEIKIKLKNDIINNININKKNNINNYTNKQLDEKELKKNKNIINSSKNKEKKEDKKEINYEKKFINNENNYNEEIKIEKSKKNLLDNIHINSEIFLTDEVYEKGEQNK